METPTLRSQNATRSKGFTLIELLTVIAIIGILAAIIIPTVGAVRSKARSARCTGNLRQMALGCVLFAQNNHDRMPYRNQNDDPNGKGKVNWYIAVAPYMGASDKITNLTTAIDYKDSGLPYMCPGVTLPVPDPKATNYGVHAWLFPNTGATPLPPNVSRIPRPSQVVMFGDTPQFADGSSNYTIWAVSGTGPWDEFRDPATPVDISGDVDGTGAGNGVLRYRHGTSTNVAFLDAHVASKGKGTLTNGNFLLTQ
jgi:prepilin-type N-terminal cleavage/methylation domain-containing protein/prepilin-type processing-associated H-X9-DG protein